FLAAPAEARPEALEGRDVREWVMFILRLGDVHKAHAVLELERPVPAGPGVMQLGVHGTDEFDVLRRAIGLNPVPDYDPFHRGPPEPSCRCSRRLHLSAA